MEKTISILSIIAIILSVLALFWANTLLFVFWEQVCFFLNAPETIIAEGPILPIGNTAYMIGCLVLVVVAYICSRSRKTIVGEVASIVLLSIVLPTVTSCLSIFQTTVISSSLETYSALGALNIANDISGLARSFMNVAASLCFVVCGMSISEKVITKKTASKANQTIE